MTAFNIDVLVLLTGAFVLGLLMGLWLRRGRPPSPSGAQHPGTQHPGTQVPGTSRAAAGADKPDAGAGERPSAASKVAAPERAAPDASSPPGASAAPTPASVPPPPQEPSLPAPPPPTGKSEAEAAIASSRTADLFGHLLTGAPPPKRPAPVPGPAATHPGSRPPTLDGPDGGHSDDLKLLKGIGPQNEQRLNALGIYHFRQIAAWTPEEVMWVGSYLAFPGRIERENWIAQAQALMSPGAASSPSREQDGAV